jgi:hypothetical protein
MRIRVLSAAKLPEDNNKPNSNTLNFMINLLKTIKTLIPKFDPENVN